MEFGNWRITEKSIEWSSGGANTFIIPVSEMNATTRNILENTVCYQWILSATNEDWLTQDDLFDLNYAFVYAFAKTGLPFDYSIFDATLEEQYEQLDMEDDEDFEL